MNILKRFKNINFSLVIMVVLFFILGVFTQSKINLLENFRIINLSDFPQTRQAETGLAYGFNLTSGQLNNLIIHKTVTVKDKSYKLISTENLNETIEGYKVEINDSKTLGQPDIFPLGEGVIIYNQKSHQAIQLYNNMIWLKQFNDYTYGLSNFTLLKDINKDGLQEFVVDSTTGGNSVAASGIFVFQITKTGGYKLLNPDLNNNPNLNVTGIGDIKDNGDYELIVSDTEWEISSCTDHSSGPITDYIYFWDNQKGYVDNSINYPGYYQKNIDSSGKITDINGEISDACTGTKSFCFGTALNQYFAYKQMGKETEGWNKFLQLTQGVTNSMWPSKTCRDFVINEHDSGKLIMPPNLTTDQLMNGQ